MIETIYSNENSDANRIGKAQTPLKMPKNIRQVGKSNGTKKIYIEDYVMTYVKQLASDEDTERKVAVLLGQCIRTEECRNIFISGAVKVAGISTEQELIFTNDNWSEIYEDIKKYFGDTEIVGWFLGSQGYMFDEKDRILKTHIDNFAGQDKLLLTYDSVEKEESFLCYESGKLNKQEGYYIYYEKNEEMQTYIIDHRKPVSSEVNYDDRVSRDIRATIVRHTEKKEEESRNVSRLMYAAGTLLAVVVLVVAAAMLRNYEQMKNMQASLDTLTHKMQNMQGNSGADPAKNADTNQSPTPTKEVTKNNDTSSGDNEEQGGLNVVVEPGNVSPIKEEDKTPTKEPTKVATKTPTKAPTKVPTKAVKKTPTPKPVMNYYVVKEGDTLADISYKLYKTYTKVKTIMQLNNITNQDHIKIGQKLIVP